MSERARLPPAETEQDFVAIAGDETALRPGVEALCWHLTLDPTVLVRFTTGSLPVYAATCHSARTASTSPATAGRYSTLLIGEDPTDLALRSSRP